MWIEINSLLCESSEPTVIPRIGGCGLKLFFICRIVAYFCNGHPPHRGMWIEMEFVFDILKACLQSSPAQGDVD